MGRLIKEIGIFYFRQSLGGGSTSFTAHLFKALEAAGYSPTILKVKAREDKVRPFGGVRQFGKYDGVHYRNVSVEQARGWVKDHPTVMAAAEHSKHLEFAPNIISELTHKGMRVVVHDPNEFKVYDFLGTMSLKQRPICIRPTMRKFFPKALFIPHPFIRCWPAVPAHARRQHAISVARIASVKRPAMVLEANRLLPVKKRVQLRGAEFRLYTRGLEQRYGDVFKQSGKSWAFPLTFEAPVGQCLDAHYNVDLTYFPDDGGGTQYAQMEAMDAGCINIMHEDWFRYGGELKPGKHVLTINGPAQLAALLRQPIDALQHAAIRANCYDLLKDHSPGVVGAQYVKELTK